MPEQAWLSEQHEHDLKINSSIGEQVYRERGYHSLDRGNVEANRARLKALGIPSWSWKEDRLFPGLLIPVWGPKGDLVTHQFRPHVAVPITKGDKVRHRKYASAVGQASRLDVHPRNRSKIIDPTEPLYITEGIKKGDSLTTRGLCTISLAGVYNWRSHLGTLGDWEDVVLKGRDVVIVFDSDARTNRNVLAAMVRLGRWLESKAARPRYLIVPDRVGEIPVKGVDDYFAAGGTLGDLLAAATCEPPKLPGSGDTFSDARLAETVTEEMMDRRWCWSDGLGWAKWDGRRWVIRRPEVEVLDEVRRWLLDRYEDAARKARDSGDATEAENWSRTLSASRITAITRLARGLVLVDADDLDQHPDLLNAANGVIDLRTGDLRPHDPDLLQTLITDAAYRADATHADWDKALEAVPADIRDWYQIRCGQAITGHPPRDDTMIIQQGDGANGKTTIATAIKYALGDHFVSVSTRALFASADAHPTEMMSFRGARFAVIEEAEEGGRLNVKRLKDAVGNPTMKARYIRQDEIEWRISHSLFLNSNYVPRVAETDKGTWRRLLLVRFPYTYAQPGEPIEGPDGRLGDPDLRERLKYGEDGQHEAVLAWLVAGAVRSYAGTKALPDRVRQDTYQWRNGADVLLGYIAEHLIADPDRHITCSDLRIAVGEWQRDRGHQEWDDKVLITRFGEHPWALQHRVERKRPKVPHTQISRPVGLNSFLPRPTQRPWVWEGVRFRTADDPDPDELDDDLGDDLGADEPDDGEV